MNITEPSIYWAGLINGLEELRDNAIARQDLVLTLLDRARKLNDDTLFNACIAETKRLQIAINDINKRITVASERV